MCERERVQSERKRELPTIIIASTIVTDVKVKFEITIIMSINKVRTIQIRV